MSDSALSTTTDLVGTGPVDAELRGRILRGIEEVLPRVLKRELPENLENVCFFEDLGLTSAGTIELVLEIEESLDIQVDIEHLSLDDLSSIGRLTDYVAGHLVDED
ncbi:acyl carrier protein [Kitasatospora mediocidica]|uniref:acyl carrier protein n=1 Tax=Kitasatospora mediocidica TaxID=58352 RepID=UPI00068CA41B|nr:acyl carrier protein [Kitasatospora mediocidica]